MGALVEQTARLWSAPRASEARSDQGVQCLSSTFRPPKKASTLALPNSVSITALFLQIELKLAPLLVEFPHSVLPISMRRFKTPDRAQTPLPSSAIQLSARDHLPASGKGWVVVYVVSDFGSFGARPNFIMVDGRVCGRFAARSTSTQLCLERDVKHKADILNIRMGQILENGDEVQQLVVVRIREPTADGNGVLGMEYVGCRGVVNDDRLL